MDNLRGRLGSTRKTKRGLGCNADSSTTLAAVIEGTVSSVAVKRHLARVSDLSRSSTFVGQRSRTDERRVGAWHRSATSRSGGFHGLSASMELKSMSHWSRNLGNPCAEKVRPHRPRQYFL